mgnify:CR=1 FL=1
MNNEKEKVISIFNDCPVKEITDYYEVALVPDDKFDLDKDLKNNDSLSKFIIWGKNIPIDKYEEVTNSIIKFTSSHSNGANGKIYIISDEAEEYANWLYNKYQGFVAICTIKELIDKYNKLHNVSVVNEPVVENNVNMGTGITPEVRTDVPASEATPVASANITMEEVKTVDNFANNVSDMVSVNPITNSNENTNTVTSSVSEPSPINPSTDNVVSINSASNNVVTPNAIEPQSINPINMETLKPSLTGAPDSNSKVRALRSPQSSFGSKLGRAAFVKFPIFLLTIMAIGAIGIFVGRMFYTYISQK